MSSQKGFSTGILILRLTTGVLMILHGLSKVLHGLGFVKHSLETHGFPTFIAYASFLGEILGPLLIIIGFRTRLGAMLIVLDTIIAIYLVQFNQILTLSPSGGWAVELPALYMFGSLTLFFTGGGKFAVSRSSWWD